MGNGAMRVIPVESAIQAETRKAPYEELSYWLTKISKPYWYCTMPMPFSSYSNG